MCFIWKAFLVPLQYFALGICSTEQNNITHTKQEHLVFGKVFIGNHLKCILVWNSGISLFSLVMIRNKLYWRLNDIWQAGRGVWRGVWEINKDVFIHSPWCVVCVFVCVCAWVRACMRVCYVLVRVLAYSCMYLCVRVCVFVPGCALACILHTHDYFPRPRAYTTLGLLSKRGPCRNCLIREPYLP